jgi:hypothetical protein
MKNILIGSIIILLWNRSFSQTTLIPINKFAPINLMSTKIKDPSGDFIRDNYALNQRIWKIHFTKLAYNKESKFLQVAGAAGLIMEEIDSFKLKNFKIHLGALRNDTLVNVKHLTKEEFLDSSGNFDVQFDLKRYTILIFSCPNRLPRIYDFSSLLH